jgi:hypothetical protein
MFHSSWPVDFCRVCGHWNFCTQSEKLSARKAVSQVHDTATTVESALALEREVPTGLWTLRRALIGLSPEPPTATAISRVCVFITAVPNTKLCAWEVCLLLQYLLQSCSRGGGDKEDMCV